MGGVYDGGRGVEMREGDVKEVGYRGDGTLDWKRGGEFEREKGEEESGEWLGEREKKWGI